MNIVEIRKNWENGDKYKVSWDEFKKVRNNCQQLPPDYIIDEDKSVKWNREEVQRRNEENKLKVQNLRKEEARRFTLLRSDIIQYIMSVYKFSHDKASYIESRCYEQYHSEMFDYFGAIDDLSNWVENIPE